MPESPSFQTSREVQGDLSATDAGDADLTGILTPSTANPRTAPKQAFGCSEKVNEPEPGPQHGKQHVMDCVSHVSKSTGSQNKGSSAAQEEASHLKRSSRPSPRPTASEGSLLLTVRPEGYGMVSTTCGPPLLSPCGFFFCIKQIVTNIKMVYMYIM